MQVPKAPVRFCVFALLVFGVFGNAGAQENEKLLRVFLMPPLSIDDESGTATESVHSLLQQSMRNSLDRSGHEIVQLPAQGSEPTQTETFLTRARKAEAPAAISLAWFRDGRRITLLAKVYDVWQERLIAGATRTSLDDISLISSCDSLMTDLLEKMEFEKPQLLAAWGTTEHGTMSRELVLLGPQDGVLVSLDGGSSLGTVQDGRLTLPFRPLALGQTTVLALDKPGFYPRTMSFIADSGTPSVSLDPLYPKSYWTVVLYMDPNMVFESHDKTVPLELGLSAALRFYPIPDTWYLRFEYGLKRIKVQLNSNGIKSPDWAMHNISFASAIALTPPDWLFRAHVGLGFGLFLTAVDGEAGFVDPFFEVPVVDVELNIHPLIVSFGFGALFVVDAGSNLLPQGLVQTVGLIRMGLGIKW